MNHAKPTSRRRRGTLIAVAVIAPCLVAGSVGIQALPTLESAVENNTSTVHGATPGSTLPEAHVTVSGAPFALAYSPNGEVSGSTPTPFVLTNEGDAVGLWDAVLVAAEGSDPAVAAATTITARVVIAGKEERKSSHTNLPILRTGTAEIDLDLGTLAEPISVMDAWHAWQKETVQHTLKFTDEHGTWWTSPPSTHLAVLESDEMSPGASYTVTITPAYDADLVGGVVSGLDDGEIATVTASFRATSITVRH